jgi:hypothetical protein
VRTIRVGIVGTPACIQGLRRRLDGCRRPIAAKDSPLGRLCVPFPGFDTSAGFRSTLVWDSRLGRSASSVAADLDRSSSSGSPTCEFPQLSRVVGPGDRTPNRGLKIAG